MSDRIKDRQEAAKWAYELMQRQDWCILDTETTGLSRDAQIVELGVLAPDETVLLDTLVTPTVEIEPEAVQVHGITRDRLATRNAPAFETVFMPLLKAVGRGDVVIYNAEFDIRLIRQSIKPYGIQLAFPTSDHRGCRIFPNGGGIYCAMHWYSQWVGELRHDGEYKWQRLPGGDHSAIGDCKAVLRIIRQMAADWEHSLTKAAEPTSAEAVAAGAETATAIEFDDIPF